MAGKIQFEKAFEAHKSAFQDYLETELNENEGGKYIKNEILDCLEENRDSEYPMAIKVRGQNAETKWMNVTKEELEKIAHIFS